VDFQLARPYIRVVTLVQLCLLLARTAGAQPIAGLYRWTGKTSPNASKSLSNVKIGAESLIDTAQIRKSVFEP